MAPPKVMTGARAQVSLINPSTNVSEIVGTFMNFAYGVVYDVQAAFILGRYGAAALEYTAMEPVNITAGAWRVYKAGPYAKHGIPKLQDLINFNDLTIMITDRENPTGDPIAVIRNIKPTGFTTNLTNRQMEEMTCAYMGLLVDEEGQDASDEGGGASSLP